jgi:Ribonuclease G/E
VNAPLAAPIYRLWSAGLGSSVSLAEIPEALRERAASLRWGQSFRVGRVEIKRTDEAFPASEYREVECFGCKGTGRAYRGSSNHYPCEGRGFIRVQKEAA